MEWIDVKTEPPKIGEYLCVKFIEKKAMYYVGTHFWADGDKGIWFCDQIDDQIYINECDECYWLKED
jgi:hypothetical protein